MCIPIERYAFGGQSGGDYVAHARKRATRSTHDADGAKHGQVGMHLGRLDVVVHLLLHQAAQRATALTRCSVPCAVKNAERTHRSNE